MKCFMIIFCFLLFFFDFCMSKDFYIGMLQKHDTIIARDRVFKESKPFQMNEFNYGREFRCKITYLKIEDKTRGEKDPHYQIIRGGLGKQYIVLRITALDKPIYLDVTVGCPIKIKQPTTHYVPRTEEAKSPKPNPGQETTTLAPSDGNSTDGSYVDGNNTTETNTNGTEDITDKDNQSQLNSSGTVNEDELFATLKEELTKFADEGGNYATTDLKDLIKASGVLSLAKNEDVEIHFKEYANDKPIKFDDLKNILSKMELKDDKKLDFLVDHLLTFVLIEAQFTKLGELLKKEEKKISKKADLLTEINAIADLPEKENIIAAITALKNENVDFVELKTNLRDKVKTQLKEAIEKLITGLTSTA